MREFDADILLARRVDSSVLISGEPGARAADVARLVHDGSRRGGAPFVAIRCCESSDALIEPLLFGHAQKSLQGGSLLLEDVGELSRRMQERLLEFLESRVLQPATAAPRVVDVRILATTTQNLVERVAEQTFLEDLFYRLNVIHLTIPPLSEQLDHIRSLQRAIVGSGSVPREVAQ